MIRNRKIKFTKVHINDDGSNYWTINNTSLQDRLIEQCNRVEGVQLVSIRFSEFSSDKGYLLIRCNKKAKYNLGSRLVITCSDYITNIRY